MKTAGIIGGTSWHSTLDMYRYVNQKVSDTMGGYHSARLLVASIDLQDILDQDTPSGKGGVLVGAAKQLEAGGANFVVICSNGLHEYAPMIEQAVRIPLLHIADSTADVIEQAGKFRIGLMGVKETMERDFYKSRLTGRGIEVLVPDGAQRDFIEKVLWEETNFGIVNPDSVKAFEEIAQSLIDRGAQGVILGCTEIGMLLKQENTDIPLFDTTIIHSDAIARRCMEE